MSRWFLKFRESQRIQEGVIEARDRRFAVAVARKFCSQVPGRQYIGVREELLADESILAEEERPPAPEPDNLKDLPVRSMMKCVQEGSVSPERCLEVERGHQNRKSMVEWLESKIEVPEQQPAA